jgi:transcription-repair coupling factor (superfamily II helicase)
LARRAKALMATICRSCLTSSGNGPKGVVLSFRDSAFADPEGLVRYIRDRGPSARVRPDLEVVFFEVWERPDARLKGTAKILRSLVNLAQSKKAA